MTNKEKIAKLYEILDEADVYRRAVGKIDFDMQTVAPEEEVSCTMPLISFLCSILTGTTNRPSRMVTIDSCK